MNAGEVWSRTRPIDGRYMESRPVGEEILIEELVTSYGGIEHARFKVMNGPQEGRKDQWAIKYIESDYRLVLA